MNDDESRIVKDPICGKDVDTLRARAVGIFGGVTYYFCSAECKAKFTDPRQASPARPPAETGERRKAEANAPKQAVPPEESPAEVRYAHSRIRRITGDVGTPVVQIDLSPKKTPTPAAAPPLPRDEEPLEPARSGRGWTLLLIVMLIIAGGVIFFTLKHR